MPAQVTVESNKPFHIIMEGQATNGGFAVDDIIFTPGSCPSKLNLVIYYINIMFCVLLTIAPHANLSDCFYVSLFIIRCILLAFNLIRIDLIFYSSTRYYCILFFN